MIYRKEFDFISADTMMMHQNVNWLVLLPPSTPTT